MTAPIDIANRALDQIRVREYVTSISPSDGSLAADIISRNYQPVLENLSRSAHWNCLRYQAQLVLLKAAQGTSENPDGTTLPIPPIPWLYEYAYPVSPQCYKARFIVPIAQMQPSNPPPIPNANTNFPLALYRYAVPFVVGTDVDSGNNLQRVILTNAQMPTMVYTARVDNPDFWDPGFVDAFVFSLAAWIAQPLSGSDSLRQMCVQSAQGLIVQARIADGNEGPSTVDHLPDFISVRGYGGWARDDNGMGLWAGYDAMNFPGGVFL